MQVNDHEGAQHDDGDAQNEMAAGQRLVVVVSGGLGGEG